MNVRTKLRGAFAAYIALLAGLSFYHVRTTQRAATSARELTAIAARQRSIGTEQPARINQIGSDAQKYQVSRDSRYRVKFEETMRSYDAELHRLEGLQLTSKERAVLAPLTTEWAKTLEIAGQLGAKPDSASAAHLLDALGQVQSATTAFAAASQLAMDEELNDSDRSERAAEKLTAFTAGTALLLSILLSALLSRSILEPLKRLAEGTREVSAGRFGHRLAAKGNNELAQVAREFNAMTERLSELDRMKQEFVSKVSHDLKTPLSSMQETNGVMLDGVAGPLTPKQRQLLEINQDSARRLMAMLNKLLDLSRVEAGLDIERQMLDVRTAVRRSVRRIM
ncbi:MAG TPA: HAMP domain-containing sensor histidine kinase, partial [Gemmatimonadaceae bacterium]